MRNQRGITLIALVITIIVLLILAGVSIAMLTGDNGILSNASKAQVETDRSNAMEKIKVALQAIKTEALAKSIGNSTYDAKTDTTELMKPEITGIAATDEGYEVSTETNKIKITYTNATTGVEVSGSIDLTGSTGGSIEGPTSTGK